MLPGIVGSLQTNEALKLIVGYGKPLIGRLLTFDAHGPDFAEVKVRRDPHCPKCGIHPVAEQAPESPAAVSVPQPATAPSR